MSHRSHTPSPKTRKLSWIGKRQQAVDQKMQLARYEVSKDVQQYLSEETSQRRLSKSGLSDHGSTCSSSEVSGQGRPGSVIHDDEFESDDIAQEGNLKYNQLSVSAFGIRP